MKRMVYAVLLSLTIAGSVHADDPERSLRIMLFAHHGPPAAAELEKVVPDARARLIAIAADDRANPAMRDRALVALAGFGGEDVKLLYDRVLADRTVRATARVHVLASYARAFPREARVVLERASVSEEPKLRAAAVAQLRALPR